jgi:hypothetical protein
MKATKWFQGMSLADLLAWWGQYGRPTQAGFYPSAPRRAARQVLAERLSTGSEPVEVRALANPVAVGGYQEAGR